MKINKLCLLFLLLPMALFSNEKEANQVKLELKRALHEEFNNKAKINGLVSYLYWPTGRCSEGSMLGHAKLELEQEAWNLGLSIPGGNKKPLAALIKSSEKSGRPFMCFRITVTPKQLKALRENIGKDSSATCSHGVFKTLSKNGISAVPLPISLSPLMSAVYLGIGKQFGFNDIKTIEFYGSSNLLKKKHKWVPGILGEVCFCVGSTMFIPTAIRVLT